MKLIGAHVSMSGGIENAPLNAAAIGAKSFAMFTKNQRQWEAAEYSDSQVAAFRQNCDRLGFAAGAILPHDAYLINLASPDPAHLEKSRAAFIDEMARCERLGLTALNFHPGSSKGKIGVEQAAKLVAEGVNLALERTKGVTAVIENMAGQGSSIGARFEEIAMIIERVEDRSRIGVCIDTCHLFAAGYDIGDRAAYDRTMEEFDAKIGFFYLRGMHINDSKTVLNSRVDRHESIGKGTISLNAFKMIMNDDRIDNIPMILETPDDTIWADEIKLLYSLID